MNKLFIGLLILLAFLVYINKNNKTTENFNMDKILYDDPLIKDKQESIKFNYEQGLNNNDEIFLEEQTKGMNLATRYYNHHIKYIDNTPEGGGKPVYNTIEPELDIVENKIRNTWDFNKPKVNNLDGYVDNDYSGKTIREVFDNSFIDYKKLIPKKDLIQTINHSDGASSLTYYTPDKWTYNGEKLENGGEIVDGLYASDPCTTGSVAIF
jgi:hypothetical protein